MVSTNTAQKQPIRVEFSDFINTTLYGGVNTCSIWKFYLTFFVVVVAVFVHVDDDDGNDDDFDSEDNDDIVCTFDCSNTKTITNFLNVRREYQQPNGCLVRS